MNSNFKISKLISFTNVECSSMKTTLFSAALATLILSSCGSHAKYITFDDDDDVYSQPGRDEAKAERKRTEDK